MAALRKRVLLSGTFFLNFTAGMQLKAQEPPGQTASEKPVCAATMPCQARPVGALPSFDAASVKPTDDSRKPARFQPGGRFAAPSVPARILLTLAYGLPFSSGNGGMIGGPDWLDSQQYDVEAIAQGNPTQDQLHLMVRSLLADRFKLAAHWEGRQLPIYALVIAKLGKTGPQLVAHSADNSTCQDAPAQPPAPPQPGGVTSRLMPPCGGGFFVSPGHLVAESTVADLAKAISWFDQIDRVVVDRTGLSGIFDITLDYAPSVTGQAEAVVPADPSLPSTIFTALQEQLGLRLVPDKGPVEVLVIDHVEKPSEN